jgi:hypothetical protein
VPGRIQVSDGTLQRLRAGPQFEARELDVKGLGHLTAHLLV